MREHNKTKRPEIIVGIGASAGGLEALQLLFSCLGNLESAAFVVIQHRAPDYKSVLVELLRKYTNMPVNEVTDGMDILSSHVYLVPPNHNMTIENDHFALKVYEQNELHHPIDVFFESLAKVKQEQAIGIILSGTGTDGVQGIRAIKEHNGITFAQNLETAKFDGMPRNAILTGLIDFVLSPKGIAYEVEVLSRLPRVDENELSEAMRTHEEMLNVIYSLLKKHTHIDFTLYKDKTVLRRLERRMVINHVAELEDYLAILESSEEEVKALGNEILIGVTQFFRDKDAFEHLKTSVVEPLVKKATPKEVIRIWVGGCCTGEEAYSIAILFEEVIQALNKTCTYKIFATDVDKRALEIAAKGIYPEVVYQQFEKHHIAKYFNHVKGSYQITSSIRRKIVFAYHNLCQDPPFGKIDLISCRNVMIYFQAPLQTNIFYMFHKSLNHDGYLFLGKSEAPGEFSEVFQPVHQSSKIYKHNLLGYSPTMKTIPFSLNVEPREHFDIPSDYEKQEKESSEESLYIHFLEQFLPASIIVNEDNDVIHFFGDYMKFIHLGQGKASFNLFKIIEDELSLALSTGLHKCRQTQTGVTYSNISLNRLDTRLNLLIHPIKGNKGEETPLVAIIFDELSYDKSLIRHDGFSLSETAAQRIIDLEKELDISQKKLIKTIGELESVNEELQAANEELLTANEELQSSNEELQSVNEELYTVNSEYQQKVDELVIVNNDISNFLSTTMIGILFVDYELNIRRFTDYIAREFHIMEHDIGRSLLLLEPSFLSYKISHDAVKVLSTKKAIERTVKGNRNKDYTVRISPYKSSDYLVTGLVITILDSMNTKVEDNEYEFIKL